MKDITSHNKAVNFEIEFKESRLKKAIKIISKMEPGTLLDIGCSNGDWANYWTQRGWKCSGVEVNGDKVAIAVSKGVNAKYCDLNSDKLPFDNNSFDFVFAGEVIEHLIDGDGFINEIGRCLKKKGKLLITTPNLVSFENRIRILLGQYPVFLDYRLDGNGHVRAFTPKILKKMLTEHGFRILKQTGNWVPFIPQKYLNDIQMPFIAFTGSILPGLAMDIIFLCEKME